MSKRNVLRKKMDITETVKVTVTGRYEKLTIPKRLVKLLKIRECHENGEETYLTFRVENGELIIRFTDEYGEELYGTEED